MTSEAMPPDPSPELTMDPMGWEYLKTAAFHLHRDLDRMAEAASRLGLDTDGYHRMLILAEVLNRHFNPPDVRRMQHGQSAPC